MNRSGRAAAAALGRYACSLPDLLVVFDDADLALGRVRVRQGGGAGGHNGLRSLMDVLRAAEFGRVKLGVKGEGREEADLADYVLRSFDPGERAVVEPMIDLGSGGGGRRAGGGDGGRHEPLQREVGRPPPPLDHGGPELVGDRRKECVWSFSGQTLQVRRLE